MTNKLTLVSFATCPFVQRAVIALKEKKVAYEIIYIDLEDKPDWFLKISPLGKVPLLKVEHDGKPEAVIFESAVILEYLEDTIRHTKLHPGDPIIRALHRGWMEFNSNLIMDFAKWTMGTDAAALADSRKAFTDKLARVEATLVGPLFSGEYFSLVDTVFAPIFTRLQALETKLGDSVLADFPKLKAWSETLLARQSVKESVNDDFTANYLERLERKNSALLKAA